MLKFWETLFVQFSNHKVKALYSKEEPEGMTRMVLLTRAKAG